MFNCIDMSIQALPKTTSSKPRCDTRTLNEQVWSVFDDAPHIFEAVSVEGGHRGGADPTVDQALALQVFGRPRNRPPGDQRRSPAGDVSPRSRGGGVDDYLTLREELARRGLNPPKRKGQRWPWPATMT